jgi:hypothetical protein
MAVGEAEGAGAEHLGVTWDPHSVMAPREETRRKGRKSCPPGNQELLRSQSSVGSYEDT